MANPSRWDMKGGDVIGFRLPAKTHTSLTLAVTMRQNAKHSRVRLRTSQFQHCRITSNTAEHSRRCTSTCYASAANTIKLKHYGTRDVEGCKRDVIGTEIPLKIQVRRAHEIHHMPYRSWCEYCVRGRGKESSHLSREEHSDGGVPVVQIDYALLAQHKRQGCQGHVSHDVRQQLRVNGRNSSPEEGTRQVCGTFLVEHSRVIRDDWRVGTPDGQRNGTDRCGKTRGI